jgi:hypothetical protein
MSPNALKLWGTASAARGPEAHDLRHSHASALHYAGFTVPDAARRLGHGPALHVETYAQMHLHACGNRPPLQGDREEPSDGLDPSTRSLRSPQGLSRVTRIRLCAGNKGVAQPRAVGHEENEQLLALIVELDRLKATIRAVRRHAPAGAAIDGLNERTNLLGTYT